MSLERRVTNLEKLRGGSERPLVFLYLSGDEPPLSEEDKERLIRETIERNPGRGMYCIMWPPQERGEDAS